MAEPADDKDNARKLAPVGAIFVGMVAARNLARRGDDRPLKALEHAERLRKSGAGESQIYTETNKMFEGSPYAGVSYGADRKPRFEISDHNAKLVPAALDKSGSGTMGRFLKNDTYYQAHPDAALLDVQKSAGGGGSFDGYKVTIGSNHFAAKQLLGRPVAKETARGVALHEKQHHAQDVEGFAPGGSPKDFETRVDRSGKRVQLSAGESREMYRRLAGEVEAENTRRRANMTPAERRAIHPSKTAEFARKDQIVTDHTGRIQEAFDPKSIKVTKLETGAAIKFDYDRETVASFKKSFPKARWSPDSKTWHVPGKLAGNRADRWLAGQQDTAAQLAKADAVARDAVAFDGAPKSRYVTSTAQGYRISTAYDPEIVKALKAIPGSSYEGGATKSWSVPHRSVEALKSALAVIEPIADKARADAQAKQVRWEAERAAQRNQWATERAAANAARDVEMAKVRASRFPVHASHGVKVGDTVRIGGKVAVVESFGKSFRVDENFSSIHGSGWLGREGETTRYAYTRPATADESATFEAKESAAKAAAEQKAKVLAAARQAKSGLEAKFSGVKPSKKMASLPAGETLAHFGKASAIYGGGTEYRLSADGKSIWRIEGNGADGDAWSRNNAPGSIVSKIRATKDAVSKLRALGEIETAGLRGTQNPDNLKAILEGRAKRSKVDQPSPPKPVKFQEMADDDIKDFGEKIGGARKDIAKKGLSRPKSEAPAGPAYERQYIAMESRHRPGEWHLFKAPSGRGGGSVGSRVGGPFTSESVANAAKPLAAVSQTFFATGKASGEYAIMRRSTKGSMDALPGVTFKTQAEAHAYMANNVDTLLSQKTPKGYGEALLREVKVTHTKRVGPEVAKGEVTPEQFMKTFNPRGVEFGHWEDGARRGKLLAASYEALHDLARATGLHPSQLTMGGQLGISFGARGTGGMNAGSATYHPDYGTMNFTKPHGAGALAHEYMHALDHLLARLDNPALDQKMTNHRGDQVWKTAGDASFGSNRVVGMARERQLNGEVRSALSDLMTTMTKKVVTEVEATDKIGKAAEYSLNNVRKILDDTRRGLTETITYRSRNNQPATPEQLARFDQHAQALLAGEGGKMPYKSVAIGRRPAGEIPYEHPHLRGIAEVMKEVRGRTGFGDHYGSLDYVASGVRSVQDLNARAAEAQAGIGKSREVATDFYREARRLDQTRTTAYWTERHEMFARAGEAWVHDKLTSKGEHSPYLVAGTKNSFEAAKAALSGRMGDEAPKPFPEGAERAAINAKFDRLFEAMRAAEVVKPAPGFTLPTPARTSMATDFESGMKAANEAAAARVTIDGKGPAGWSDEARAKSAEVRAAEPEAPKTVTAKPKLVTTGESSTPKRTPKAKVEAKPRAAVAGDNGGPSDKAIKTAAKLEAVAKRTIAEAQAVHDQPRQMNTARRARMGSGVMEEQQRKIANAKTALKIAEALRNGEAGTLVKVESLADVERVSNAYRSAMYANDQKRKEYRGSMTGVEPEVGDIKHAKPVHTSVRGHIFASDIEGMKKALAGKGVAREMARLEKAANRPDGWRLTDPKDIEALAKVAKAVKTLDPKDTSWAKYGHQARNLQSNANQWLGELREYEANKRLGLNSTAELHTTLEAFAQARVNRPKADPVAAAERDLIGRKLPGFFPTPASLADRMAQMADVKPGMKVLEPSAGTGRLADAAKKLGATVDTVEMQSSLRDILLKKGHNVVEHDFTSMKAEPKYDRIVMNPPFEKGQDMAHVRQAYEMLKPGGKMVAVMGEGAFFRGDTKASEFRNWLETVGTSEKLPEGTFKESNTGVNTRLVTITKPAEASSAVKNENRGWSDAARAASADARGVAKPGEAKPKPSPTVQSAVERAMAMQEAKAKTSAPSTLAAPKPVEAAPTPANMSGSGSKRYVTLGDGRKVTLGQYTEAWKLAKSLPPSTKVRGSPDATFRDAPNTAGDAVQEFRRALNDRINQKTPGFEQGRKWDATWQSDARRLAETMARKSEVPAGEAHPVDLRNKVADRLAPSTKLPPKGGTGIKGKVMGLMAPVAIGSAALIAMNESAKAGETTGQQVKAGSIEAVKGGAVMGGFVAGTIAITKGLTKAGLTAAKAVPATQAILMAGGAIHGAVTAKPGERMKGAAKGAWDMSVPGMVVNTYEAGKAAYHSTADRLSSPSRMTTEQAQHFNQANAAYKADHQSGPITVEQFERTRRLPSGAVVTETVSTHTRARRD